MNIQKIILVFKTHFDIGFTKLSSEILDYYGGDMLDRVAETCEGTKDMGDLRYVWTMPSWPLSVMRQRGAGERAKMLDDLIERGQVTWHALPYTSHYDFCGVEDAVWGLGYAKELSGKYHQPLRRAAKMTDVPGHGRFLPELLADAGIRFLHLGCNEFATPPKVPPLFWWEAPSGKRVLTMYSCGYGTTMLPDKDWPFATWMALMNTQDNCGPQSAELVKHTYDRIHAEFPEAQVVCGTLDEVWEALSKEDLSGLPVVKSDLADTWIHGVASYPRESAIIRRLRARLSRVNRARALNPEAAKATAADVAEVYDGLALFGEHTWGLDVKTWLGAIPDYDQFESYRKNERCARMEASWKEQTDRALAAQAACARAEQALGLEAPRAEAEGEWQTLTGPRSLTGSRWRMEFSADTGVIHTLYDLKRNCCMLAQRGDTGVFSYRYDRYGADEMAEYLRAYGRRYSDWGILDNGRANYPECSHVTRRPAFESCEQRGRTVRFTYRACEGDRLGDARKVILTVTVPEDDRPVRVRVAIEGKRATPYVESGALCFPLAMDAPRYSINKTGSVLDPETDIASGANHGFYALEHFAAAGDARGEVGVVTHDCPLVSLGENGVYAYRREYEPHAPEMRFCLFNNMWGTNFPQWIEGDMAFEFDVITADAGDVDSLYIQAAKLAENPDGINLPELPFTLPEGVRVTNFLPEEEGLTLRVQSLRATGFTGRIAGEGWTFEEQDLLGRTLSEPTQDGVDVAFAPYDLRSFRVRKK